MRALHRELAALHLLALWAYGRVRAAYRSVMG